MTDSSPPRRGPRGQAAATRAAILREARRAFAAYGYAGTSLRHVATQAGVDVALLPYYFGSKENLFAQAIELPLSPREVVAAAVDVPLDQLGESLIRGLLTAWADEEAAATARGVLQSLSTRDDFAATVIAYSQEHVVGPLAQRLGTPDASYRATLAIVHLVGLAVTRHVALMPMAGADEEALVADIAPVIQHYLTGELSSGRGAGPPHTGTSPF